MPLTKMPITARLIFSAHVRVSSANTPAGSIFAVSRAGVCEQRHRGWIISLRPREPLSTFWGGVFLGLFLVWAKKGRARWASVPRRRISGPRPSLKGRKTPPDLLDLPSLEPLG